MPASTYLGNMLLDSILRGQAFTLPTSVFVALHTADPTVAGINEVTLAAWPAYVRVDADQGATIDTGWSVPAAKSTANAKVLLYPIHDGGANITITHFSVWDAATGGNMLVYGALTAAKTISPADQIQWNAGTITATVT